MSSQKFLRSCCGPGLRRLLTFMPYCRGWKVRYTLFCSTLLCSVLFCSTVPFSPSVLFCSTVPFYPSVLLYCTLLSLCSALLYPSLPMFCSTVPFSPYVLFSSEGPSLDVPSIIVSVSLPGCLTIFACLSPSVSAILSLPYSL